MESYGHVTHTTLHTHNACYACVMSLPVSASFTQRASAAALAFSMHFPTAPAWSGAVVSTTPRTSAESMAASTAAWASGSAAKSRRRIY